MTNRFLISQTWTDFYTNMDDDIVASAADDDIVNFHGDDIHYTRYSTQSAMDRMKALTELQAREDAREETRAFAKKFIEDEVHKLEESLFAQRAKVKEEMKNPKPNDPRLERKLRKMLFYSTLNMADNRGNAINTYMQQLDEIPSNNSTARTRSLKRDVRCDARAC